MYEELILSWIGNRESRLVAAACTSDDRFLQIVSFLAENPRLRIDRDESRERHYLDGFASYEYGILNSECWHLAEIVPVNEVWAHCLHRLYSRMRPAYKPYKDLLAVLDRWHPEGESDYSETKTFRQILISLYVQPSLSTLTHKDEAYRRAFYQTFNPDDEDLHSLDWMEWRKRDKYCEVEIQTNDKVWKSRRGRIKLKRMLWEASNENSDISAIGWFEELEETHRVQHPEWFTMEEDGFEAAHDPHEARMALSTDLSVARSTYGAGTFAAEAECNMLIGLHILRDELGDFGKKGLPVYSLDDDTRDRMLAHVRQDVAAALGHAKSAFRSARKAEKAANWSNVLLCFLIGLLLYMIVFG